VEIGAPLPSHFFGVLFFRSSWPDVAHVRHCLVTKAAAAYKVCSVCVPGCRCSFRSFNRTCLRPAWHWGSVVTFLWKTRYIQCA